MADESLNQVVPHRMHGGRAMSIQEIDRICRRRVTPIVFMAGDIGSGKTTLIASIHDAFLFGPLAGFRFAGSQTLVAFEERSFESRAKSNGIIPQTVRTRYDEGQAYFHLTVQDEKDPSHRNLDLLFADMSGEFYERSIRRSAEAQELKDLRRAQYLLVLLDGERLADINQRQGVRSNAHTFIRRCVEQGVLTSNTELQVLISKWDTVSSLPEEVQAEVLDFVTSRINEKQLNRPVYVGTIASRPAPGASDPKLLGVRELFPQWLRSSPKGLQERISLPVGSSVESNFLRFPGRGTSL